jgi:hypothetical protein
MANGKRTEATSRKTEAGYKLPKPGPVSLEAFLEGQRQINGSFYEILDNIMDALGTISVALSAASGSADAEKRSNADGPLARTKKLVKDVPGIDPPGCVPPPPPGGNG